MDPISPAILAKWAGPMASRFAVGGIGRLTYIWRVARSSAKRAAAAGVPISAKSLRTWLAQADTAQQLRQCTEHSLAQTAERLAFLVPGSDTVQRRANSLQVLKIVMEEYIRLGTPAQAALLAGDWGQQTTVEDGSKTREKVQKLREDVLGRLEARAGFSDDLRTLSPWSAREARRLLSVWPTVETVVGLLAKEDTTRSMVLQQWADQEPAWLREAPAQAFGWLGQVAADYGARHASYVFLERCIRDGGYPRDSLVAFAALQVGSGTEQEIRDYLAAHHDTTSPVVEALRAYLDQDWAGCLEQLGRWEPRDPMAQATKVQLEADALISMDRDGEALARLRAAEREVGFTGLALHLARALLKRAIHVRSQNRLTDAQEALAVAVRARNSRRVWYGDSTAATVVAVQAAVLCQDLPTAWSLTQPAPEGEALPHEADDSRLREQRALVAALSGREREAQQSLDDIENEFTKSQVMALVAEYRLEGDTENPQVRALWRQAWDAAQSEPEQLTAAMGLAEAGAVLPDLEHLRARFPDAVAEIELLARALRNSSSEQLAVLRANVASNPVIVLKLAERYHRRGDVELAAQTLEDGATHWRDPRLMAMAAGYFREAGAYPSARDCAETALRMAGPGWAGQSRMYALLVEIESADGHMDRATDAAVSLLALDPEDVDARWALVRCQAARVLVEQAWRTLTEHGAPLEPRSRDEALLWVELGARFSSDQHFIGRALTMMQRWPEDEELLGRFLNILHRQTAGTTEPLSEQDLEQLQNATASYLERFPNSSVLRAVAVGSDDNPLQNIGDELRRAHESTKEVVGKIEDGQLPVGVLTWATGRTYAECCISRAAGVVYAAHIPHPAAEAHTAQSASTGRTVLDTTAAATLALLDRQTSEQLIGYVQAVTTTDQLLADALQAKESLALQSELTLNWDERTGNAAVSSSTPEQIAALRATATRLVEIMQATTRVSRPELRSFPPLPGGRRRIEWMTAIDYAKEHGLVLWCDDRVMRALARAENVAVFGTLSLIDACRSSGLLTSQETVVIKAELLRNYFVDIPFSAELYRAAAQADRWRAKAVAMALSRPAPWANPQAAAVFVLDAASQAVTSMPDEVLGWLGAAYAGLHRASLPSYRSRNLRMLCLQILTQPWISTSSLPFALAGLHAGVQAVAGTDTPIQAALTQFYGTLVENLGHIIAANTLMSLFALTEEKDKATAARIVLTYPAR